MNPKLSLAQLFALKACAMCNESNWYKVNSRTSRGLWRRKWICDRNDTAYDVPELTIEGRRVLEDEMTILGPDSITRP